MKNIKSAEKSNVENYSTKLSLQLQNNLQKWILKEYNWEDYHPTSPPKSMGKHCCRVCSPIHLPKESGIPVLSTCRPVPQKNKTGFKPTQVYKKPIFSNPQPKKNNQPPSSLSRPTWPSGHFAIPSPCMGSWCPWRFLFGAFSAYFIIGELLVFGRPV